MIFGLLATLVGVGAMISFVDDENESTDETNIDHSADSPSINPDAILGTDGPDRIENADNADPLEYFLYDGSDNLEAGPSDDTVHAGEGYNFISAGAGDDIVNGGSGQDVIWGQEGQDTLLGNDGNDQIYDTEGFNLIDGGAGNDHILAGSNSTVSGGSGEDTFGLFLDLEASKPVVITDFDPSEDIITGITITTEGQQALEITAVDREDGTGADLYHGTQHIAAFEGSHSSDLGDIPVSFVSAGYSITDYSGDATISGTGGDEQEIHGGDGDDRLSGGLNHGAEGDSLNGGSGDDILTALGASSAVYTHGEGGTETIQNQTQMRGDQGNDTLISTNSNILTGGEGSDLFALSQSHYHSTLEVEPTEITDYNPEEDQIMIEGAYLKDGEALSIVTWDDGTGADIVVGDLVIANVTGGQDLSADDIIISSLSLEEELLGHH